MLSAGRRHHDVGLSWLPLANRPIRFRPSRSWAAPICRSIGVAVGVSSGPGVGALVAVSAFACSAEIPQANQGSCKSDLYAKEMFSFDDLIFLYCVGPVSWAGKPV